MRIIDAQVHVYEADHPDRPWDGAAAQRLMESARKEGFDIPGEVSDTELLVLMDEAGVDGAVLVTFGTLYGFDNSYVIEAAARHPDRFAAVGRFDPRSPTVHSAVADFAARPGAVGMRVLAHDPEGRRMFATGMFDPIFDAASAYGLSACIYAPGALTPLHRYASRHPELQFVIDHMGVSQHVGAARELDDRGRSSEIRHLLDLAQYPNVRVKLTGLPTLSGVAFPFDDLWPTIHLVIETFGHTRLMWGTDTTRTPYPYREEVDYLRESPELSAEEKEWILARTLEETFNWRAGRPLDQSP